MYITRQKKALVARRCICFRSGRPEEGRHIEREEGQKKGERKRERAKVREGEREIAGGARERERGCKRE